MATETEATAPIDTTDADLSEGGDLLQELDGSEVSDEFADAAAEERSSDAATDGNDPKAETPDPAAAQQTGETTAEAEPKVEDLLASATPLDYTVNGETRTFDGISVIPGQGAIIPESALPALRDRLQQAESARADARQLYQKTQEYEALEYTGANNQPVRGLDAIRTAMAEAAAYREIARTALEHIRDPQKIVALATDPTALSLLTERLDVIGERAMMTAQKAWGERQSAATQQQETAPDRLTGLLSQHLDSLKQYAPDLTDADWQEAKAVFGPFASQIVRRATPDEARAAGVKVGSLIVDNNRMLGWLTQRTTQRQQEAAAKAAAARTDAENKKRLAAANAGKSAKPQASSARPGAGKPTQKPAEPTYEEILRAAKAGRFLPSVVGEDE